MQDECCTTWNKRKLRFKWTITEISMLIKQWKDEEDDICLNSAVFQSADENDSQWQIELKFERLKERPREYLHFGLHLVKSNVGVVTASWSPFLIDKNNKVMENSRRAEKMNKFVPDDDIKSRKSCKFLARCDVKSYVQNKLDKLIVGCDIILYTPSSFCRKLVIPKITSNFQNLYKNTEDSDFTFIVGDKNFSVHKLILKNESPVFAAMFKHETTEQTENQTTITDVEPDVFEKVLEFIYTNKVIGIRDGNCVMDLFFAADKYELNRLKNMCEEVLYEKINAENAAEILSLAHLHNAQYLLEYTKGFINANQAQVVETPGFQALEKSFPNLIIQLYKRQRKN